MARETTFKNRADDTKEARVEELARDIYMRRIMAFPGTTREHEAKKAMEDARAFYAALDAQEKGA